MAAPGRRVIISSVPYTEGVFSSSLGHFYTRSAIAQSANALFCVFFPSFCRICDRPLRHARRLPVCDECLNSIQPLAPGAACRRCGKATAPEAQPCPDCRNHEPEYDSAVSWTAYEGIARELIHLLKYRGVMPAADYLADRLAQRLAAQEVDTVVAVPLGRARQRERGYNQSARVARRLAHCIQLPEARHALVRKRETSAQSGLTAEERESNVRGAFAVEDPRAVSGRRVLLVDDVLTTGATARACAAALKQAGADAVHLVTVARADLRAFASPQMPADARRS